MSINLGPLTTQQAFALSDAVTLAIRESDRASDRAVLVDLRDEITRAIANSNRLLGSAAAADAAEDTQNTHFHGHSLTPCYKVH